MDVLFTKAKQQFSLVHLEELVIVSPTPDKYFKYFDNIKRFYETRSIHFTLKSANSIHMELIILIISFALGA